MPSGGLKICKPMSGKLASATISVPCLLETACHALKDAARRWTRVSTWTQRIPFGQSTKATSRRRGSQDS